jgi:hypothetical protein
MTEVKSQTLLRLMTEELEEQSLKKNSGEYHAKNLYTCM